MHSVFNLPRRQRQRYNFLGFQSNDASISDSVAVMSGGHCNEKAEVSHVTCALSAVTTLSEDQ